MALLEGHFELILANAAHVKNVPGRKTDVNDAMWLADLLAHGLIRASFVPPAAVQELRALTRTRKQFVRERGAHVQRIEKVLEDATSSSASCSPTSWARAAAPSASHRRRPDDPEHCSRVGRVKASRAELLEALRGRISAHHRFMLKLHLGHIDALDQAIATIEQEVGLGLEPFRRAAQLAEHHPRHQLMSAAHVVVAEIGIDMARFQTPAHLRSWACLCPRNDESAGKRRSTRLRRGGK